ncbi:MAG: hypothetical protein ACJ76Z_07085 [Thermoleophilaceae bacterium]
MARLALLACLALVAFAALASPAAAAGSTVTGVAYQDANADGVRQDGENGLVGWVVWADLDGNGARDPSEPSATAAVDGSYALGPLAPGDYTLRVQPPDGSICPPSATCAWTTTVAAGEPVTIDFPIASATDPGRQLIDPEPVRVGSVALSVPHGCVRRPFVAALTGTGITRVDFRVDRRRSRSVRKADGHGRWSLRVDPRRLRAGRHTLTAAVWFSNASAQPAKQVSAHFRSCARSH